MSENLAPQLVTIREGVAALRAACDRIERNQSDPEETRQALSDIAAGYGLIVQLAEVAGVQRGQIHDLVTALSNRVPGDELRSAFDDVFFQTKQLIGIMQGTRDDLVLMRSDLRRLAALLEQTLRARAEDEEAWGGLERRNSIADRRRAS